MIYLYYAAAIGLIVAIYYFKHPSVKGRLGEEAMARQLKKLNTSEYRVLNDLHIAHNNGHTTQIDHVVVSIYGIFVIETKNYKGRISGKVSDREWVQSFNRKSKYTLYNPILQNDGHVQAIERLIKKHTNLPVISIIAFSNSAKIAVRTTKHVVNAWDVISVIYSYTTQYIEPKEIQSVVEEIHLGVSTSEDFMKVHRSNVYKAQNNKNVMRSTKSCPKCNARLVKRSGKHGEFYGCSRYPRCRYTRNVS